VFFFNHGHEPYSQTPVWLREQVCVILYVAPMARVSECDVRQRTRFIVPMTRLRGEQPRARVKKGLKPAAVGLVMRGLQISASRSAQRALDNPCGRQYECIPVRACIERLREAAMDKNELTRAPLSGQQPPSTNLAGKRPSFQVRPRLPRATHRPWRSLIGSVIMTVLVCHQPLRVSALDVKRDRTCLFRRARGGKYAEEIRTSFAFFNKGTAGGAIYHLISPGHGGASLAHLKMKVAG